MVLHRVLFFIAAAIIMILIIARTAITLLVSDVARVIRAPYIYILNLAPTLFFFLIKIALQLIFSPIVVAVRSLPYYQLEQNGPQPLSTAMARHLLKYNHRRKI